MNRTYSLLLLGLLPLSLSGKPGQAEDAVQNLANEKDHPYLRAEEHRELHEPTASHPINKFRVYEFYQRQADYYLNLPESEVPVVLPAFPGIDGGKFGHWGKNNQNNYKDGRWNEMDHGPLITQVFRTEEITVLKGMSIRLPGKAATVFDPQALSHRAVWQGGHVEFQPFRWGTSRNGSPAGKVWTQQLADKGWKGSAEGHYLGHYRNGEQVILNYQIGETEILELPGGSADDSQMTLTRRLHFPHGTAGLTLLAGTSATGANSSHFEVSPQTISVTEDENGGLWLDTGKLAAGATIDFTMTYWDPAKGKPARPETTGASLPPLTELIKGGPTHFPARLKVESTVGKPLTPDSSYAIDTLGVPFDNPYRSVMQLSGVAFFADGSALVTTVAGEVWKVTGIDDSLREVTWKRYASGFNQPMGLRIDEDGVFVLDRGQITRLHDLNGDDEVDFYENYANDFGGYDRSHSHTFGLNRLADGSFVFIQRESILQTGPDRKTREIASGVRNCMGVGGTPEYTLIAPQEGTWTAASMIIEVHNGEFYGLPKKGSKRQEISPAMAYIPRGVDNSTGGIVQVKGDRFGPLQDHFIGLSYGAGSHYLILRDSSGPRSQGAIVPLEGDFLAGIMRGETNPVDGQLYVAGLDGWGDYSVQDGCLQRVRFTGKPFRHPIGFQVHSNGVRVDFAEKVDPTAARVFAHQWNYEYAQRYGSPEFSVRKPSWLGHDRVEVRNVISLNDGKSIFVEMPSLEPAMQLHLRMHLKTGEGQDLATDIFPTIVNLGEPFSAEGLLAPQTGKVAELQVRVKGRKANDDRPTQSGDLVEGARVVTVNTIGGLQFEQKEIIAKPGEPLTLLLKNKDVMPHNLVVVKSGAIEEVGTASFAMLNDPAAGDKHYVPNLDSVLYNTFVVSPGNEHRLHFLAPDEPGDYPYICTFPGHWQAMQGVLKVR